MKHKILSLLAWLLLTGVALAAPPQLRVLSYNIHHGEGTDGKLDLARLAAVIEKAKPDLVALQEVDVETTRTGKVDQAKKLAELTKLHVAFGEAMPFGGGKYGNAILSRWPLDKPRTIALPYDKTKQGQEPRCALVASIKTDNGLPELAFASVHLCHLSGDTRSKQVAELSTKLISDDAPVTLLAGDFNARNQEAAMKSLLEKTWQDASAKIAKIDHVLYLSRDPWRVVEAQHLDEPVASDHLPLLTILEWTK